ncbi:MAG TPA: hypothetical protein VIK66_14900 [Gaiellaceae bacterium]|jgi:uncharacterized membrane protein YeaQ/YmgE (transglycosylase-associated protein family)
MAGLVVSALITGLVTGMLARFAIPGPDPMPLWLTILVGLAGTAIGGAVVVAIGSRDPSWVAIGGFIAAVVLVGLYRRFVQRRPLWGPDAYRFPERGVGVPEYRERLERAGIDPDALGNPFAPPTDARQQQPQPRPGAAEDPTENPAHFLGRLAELHDAGVLTDDEYDAARLRLLERLRA